MTRWCAAPRRSTGLSQSEQLQRRRWGDEPIHGREGVGRRFYGAYMYMGAGASVVGEVLAVDGHLQFHVALAGLLQLHEAKCVCEPLRGLKRASDTRPESMRSRCGGA
jgi:hypothetical protein